MAGRCRECCPARREASPGRGICAASSAGCWPRSCSGVDGAPARWPSIRLFHACRPTSRCPADSPFQAMPGVPRTGTVAGMRDVDMAIIGAGPTGLFAAYYAGFRGLSTAVIDALPEPGGQVTAMYPEKMIYDVAGFPAIRGRDLIANLVAQAAPYRPTYLMGQRAETLTYDDGRPVIGF